MCFGFDTRTSRSTATGSRGSSREPVSSDSSITSRLGKDRSKHHEDAFSLSCYEHLSPVEHRAVQSKALILPAFAAHVEPERRWAMRADEPGRNAKQSDRR
jgi:hypothetical protein